MSQGIFVKDKSASSGDLLLPWLFGIIAVSMVFAAQFLAAYALVFAGFDYLKYEGVYLFAYGVIAIIVFPLFAKITGKYYSDKKNGLVLKVPKVNEVVLTVAFTFGLLGVVAIYMTAVTFLSEHLNTVKDQLEVYSETIDRFSEVTPEEVPFFDQILDYIAMVFVVPIVEEIVFRGIILGQFRKCYSGWFSIAISAVVFGLIHGISVHIGYALMCGVCLGMIYYFTSNLVLTITAHVTFNFFGGALPTMLDSGFFDISTETANKINHFISVFELYMVPAVALVMAIFILRYKSKKKKEQVITVDSVSDGTRTANVGDFAGSKDDSDQDGENNTIKFVIK